MMMTLLLALLAGVLTQASEYDYSTLRKRPLVRKSKPLPPVVNRSVRPPSPEDDEIESGVVLPQFKVVKGAQVSSAAVGSGAVLLAAFIASRMGLVQTLSVAALVSLMARIMYRNRSRLPVKRTKID